MTHHDNYAAAPNLADILDVLNELLRKQDDLATRQAIQQMELESLKANNESADDVYQDSIAPLYGSNSPHPQRRSQQPPSQPSTPLHSMRNTLHQQHQQHQQPICRL
jgi:hypothetical protein